MQGQCFLTALMDIYRGLLQEKDARILLVFFLVNSKHSRSQYVDLLIIYFVFPPQYINFITFRLGESGSFT